MELQRVTSAQKLAFESAYDNLAQTVRSFSREKIRLEEVITDNGAKVTALESSLSEKNKENEAIIEENKRLQTQHEFDEAALANMQALINNTANRHGVLTATVEQFNDNEDKIQVKHAWIQEMVASLKLRQLELFENFNKSVVEKDVKILELSGKLVALQAETDAQVEQYQADVEQLQGKLHEIDVSLREKVIKMDHILAQMKEADAQNEAQIEGYKKLLEESENAVAELKRAKEETFAENVKLSSKLMALQVESTAQIEIFEEKLRETEDALNAKVAKIDELCTQMEELEVGNQAEVEGYKKKVEESEGNVAELKKANEEKYEENVQLSSKLMALQVESEAELEILKEKLRETEDALSEKVTKIDELCTQMKELEVGNQAEVEGYKKLLEESDNTVAEFKKANEEKYEENVQLSSKLMALQVESTAQIEILEERLRETEDALSAKVTKMDDLVAQMKESDAQNEARVEGYKRLLEESENNVAQLKKRPLTSGNPSPRLSPFRASASMGNLTVRSAPSGILKSRTPSGTSMTKRVSWGDSSTSGSGVEDMRKKLYEPVTFSSSSSDEESGAGEKVDPTFEIPLKRSRLSAKEKNKNNNHSGGRSRSSSSSSREGFMTGKDSLVPQTPLRRTKSLSAQEVNIPNTPSHYNKFFRNLPEGKDQSPASLL